MQSITNNSVMLIDISGKDS